MKLTAKNIAIIAAVLFTIGCLYSALVEEIIPYWKSGNKHQFWTHIIGGLHNNDFVIAAKSDEVYDKDLS